MTNDTKNKTSKSSKTQAVDPSQMKVAKGSNYGTGRRKAAIAKVWLFPGNGQIVVNGLDYKDYFKSDVLIKKVILPLTRLGIEAKYNCVITCLGGGLVGQSDAACLGVARALLEMNPSFRSDLKEVGCLTRDPRVKERKKYGLRKARKAPQYRKR